MISIIQLNIYFYFSLFAREDKVGDPLRIQAHTYMLQFPLGGDFKITTPRMNPRTPLLNQHSSPSTSSVLSIACSVQNP